MTTPLTDVRYISRIAYGFMGSKALFSALSFDLFSHLAGDGKTLETLVEETGIASNRLRTLLAALTAIGPVDRQGNAYRNAPASDRYLVRGAPAYFGDYYRFQIDRQIYPALAHLDAGIAGDTQHLAFDSLAGLTGDPEEADAFTRAQHAGSMGPAVMLARNFDLSGAARLLDVGGGSGAFSIALCQRNPELRATVMDFPPWGHGQSSPAAAMRTSASCTVERATPAAAAISLFERLALNLSRAISFNFRMDNLACATVAPLCQGQQRYAVIRSCSVPTWPDSCTDIDRNAVPTCAGIAYRHAPDYAALESAALSTSLRRELASTRELRGDLATSLVEQASIHKEIGNRREAAETAREAVELLDQAFRETAKRATSSVGLARREVSTWSGHRKRAIIRRGRPVSSSSRGSAVQSRDFFCGLEHARASGRGAAQSAGAVSVACGA